jgi:hypothetical protein
MKTKICVNCGEEKSLEEFYFRKDNNCYRKECKICFSQKTKLIKYELYPWRKHFYSARRRCENSQASDYKFYGQKGIKFLLNENEVKKIWERNKAYKLDKPSIDRIDSRGNYTFDNCQFIEMDINRAKRGFFVKPIFQFDLQGNFIKEWDSITEAQNCYGCGISNCLCGNSKTAYKFIWRYKNV